MIKGWKLSAMPLSEGELEENYFALSSLFSFTFIPYIIECERVCGCEVPSTKKEMIPLGHRKLRKWFLRRRIKVWLCVCLCDFFISFSLSFIKKLLAFWAYYFCVFGIRAIFSASSLAAVVMEWKSAAVAGLKSQFSLIIICIHMAIPLTGPLKKGLNDMN